MSNVRKGHDFEREVKKHFTDADWGCTRAACSKSRMDLIAYKQTDIGEYIDGIDSVPVGPFAVFRLHGYTIKRSKSGKVPLLMLASKREGKNFKHVYFNAEPGVRWTVVLMQCKIGKRR